MLNPCETQGLHPQTNLITEKDVYRLVMNSKLPAAQEFEEWVVSEVLPSIRKTGAYVHGQDSVNPREATAQLDFLDFMEQQAMCHTH